MADDTTRVTYFDKKGNFTNSSTTTLKYPKDLNDTEEEFAWTKFRFFKYSPPLAVQRQSTTTGQDISNYNSSVSKQQYIGPTIALYSPEDIQAEYGVQWGGRSIQNFTRETIANVANANTGGALSGLLNSFKDLDKTGKDAAAYAFSAAAAAGLLDGLAGL